MNFSLEKFDELMAQAQDAAAGFDGRGIVNAMQALTAYMDDLIAQANMGGLTEDALQHIRSRLERYQKLCAFLQQTLHNVLMGALQTGGPPCYRGQGRTSYSTPRGGQESHLAPLIRRYC